jgi:hypothetical protein
MEFALGLLLRCLFPPAQATLATMNQVDHGPGYNPEQYAGNAIDAIWHL